MAGVRSLAASVPQFLLYSLSCSVSAVSSEEVGNGVSLYVPDFIM